LCAYLAFERLHFGVLLRRMCPEIPCEIEDLGALGTLEAPVVKLDVTIENFLRFELGPAGRALVTRVHLLSMNFEFRGVREPLLALGTGVIVMIVPLVC